MDMVEVRAIFRLNMLKTASLADVTFKIPVLNFFYVYNCSTFQYPSNERHSKPTDTNVLSSSTASLVSTIRGVGWKGQILAITKISLKSPSIMRHRALEGKSYSLGQYSRYLHFQAWQYPFCDTSGKSNCHHLQRSKPETWNWHSYIMAQCFRTVWTAVQ